MNVAQYALRLSLASATNLEICAHGSTSRTFLLALAAAANATGPKRVALRCIVGWICEALGSLKVEVRGLKSDQGRAPIWLHPCGFLGGPLRVNVPILTDLHPGSTARRKANGVVVLYRLTRFAVVAVLHSAGGVEIESGCLGWSFDCLRMIQNNT